MRYKLIDENDPNQEIELQSTNEKDATAEAFEGLGWQLIVMNNEAGQDLTLDDTPAYLFSFCEDSCPKQAHCKREEFTGCLHHPAWSSPVSMIASGYEWDCPMCGRGNTEIEYSEKVVCEGCQEEFKTDPPDHALG